MSSALAAASGVCHVPLSLAKAQRHPGDTALSPSNLLLCCLPTDAHRDHANAPSVRRKEPAHWAKPAHEHQRAIRPPKVKQTKAHMLFCSCTLAAAPVHSRTPAAEPALPPGAARRTPSTSGTDSTGHRALPLTLLAGRQVMCLTLKHLDLNLLVGENIKSLLVIPVDVFTSSRFLVVALTGCSC